MTNLALSISNLVKIYPQGTNAIKDISFDVTAGDFFALLGPNGAGKSTTIGIIVSLINKTSGKVLVFGDDIDKNLSATKACIGIVPQEFNFNNFETIIDIMIEQAGYYGVPRQIAKIRAEFYLQKLGLWEKHDEIALHLSGGMKRRLMIARALIHQPALLILDEPTAGVDIETRHLMWQFLRELNQQGTTIILTTHYLEEAENLCRNIAIIDKGKLIHHTSMKHLLHQLNAETYIFYLKNILTTTPQLGTFVTQLLDESTLEIQVRKDQTLNQLFTIFSLNELVIIGMRNKINRLEEIFLNLIKKENHD